MINEILSKMTVEEKVGQMCVPILQSDVITEEIKRAVTEYHVGMIRYCPDAEFDNASVAVGEPNKYFKPDENAEFLNDLQKLSKLPLIISVDQEGGCRSDINRNNAMVYASHMCFGVADDVELTYEVAKATAKEFRSMGINQIQAPICDVFRYPGRQTMKAATFGENAEAVAKHVVALRRGYGDGGVLSMGKHFPGYGSIATDAHKGTAHITKTVEELENEDIVPFKKLIDAGVDGIMMGHVIVDAIDPQYPATLSRILTTGYLREKLGFKGIIMTDAMRMKAIQDNYGTGVASVLAIKAGCDLVLLRGDENHFKDGYDAILAAAKSGEISEEVLNASVLRILKAKEKAGLFENRFADPENANKTVGTKENQELLFKLASKSISVFREKLMPLNANDGKKISVISVEPQKIVAALDEKQCVDMLEKEIRAIHKNTNGIVIKLDPDEQDIKTAVETAKDADIIVLGMCSGIIFKNQVPLYEALKALGKDMIIVAMESPCDIELVPDCTDYIATYGAARDWMKVAAERIFGLTNVNGKAPITIPGVND
ncbi:MAG: glycoside hydrolase family 3 protein [Ruminococcaceae bacterium]|nr:glycoside hydrolase family 3 protein [Oscillospiraceae bacterium]